jgi:hypothetical protein
MIQGHPFIEQRHGDFTMILTDYVAVYGAVVATAVAVWDVFKWKKGRTNITLSCYLAKMVGNMVVPSGGRLYDGTSDEEDQRRKRFVVYKIKNTGGTSITVLSLGGKDKDGKPFVVSGSNLPLPQTVQAHASVSIYVPLDGTSESIREFCVTDDLDTEWCCKAGTFQKQLAEYRWTMGNQG